MNNKEELLGLVGLINNVEIANFTRKLLDAAPNTFWTAKASRNHHPLDEKGNGGNLLHTVRVVKLVRIMAEGCQLDQIDVDILTSAAILHDICRYGLTGTEDFTTADHPQLVRELARINKVSCPRSVDVFVLIERHMGKWGDKPYNPEITPSAILHMADVVSARAEQVWGGDKLPEAAWVGDTPFKGIGMTKDKMELLKELADDNEYWKSTLKFINQISSRKLSSLTDRQRDWLSNIIASLDVELDRQAPKEVFDESNEIPF